MKYNKIISLIIICALLLSCSIPAFADTPETIAETIAVTSGNGNVATVAETSEGSGVWEVVTADTVGSDEGDLYVNAGGARIRFGSIGKSAATNIALTQAQDGTWSADAVLRYSAKIKTYEDMTRFDFWTYYYLDNVAQTDGSYKDDVLQTPTSVYPIKPAESDKYSPGAGEEFIIDAVVDLNTLTSYFYIDNELCGSHTLTIPEGVTNPRFATAKFYLGSASITTGGVKLYDISDIKKYTYPAGTSLSAVQTAITDVFKVKSVVPVTLASWRWTLPENSETPGTYDLTMVHDSAFNGSIGIPFDVNLSDGTSGVVRVSATINSLRNLNSTQNALNGVYMRDGTRVGDYNLTGVGTKLTFATLYQGTYKLDAFVDKSTKTIYYYLNGRQVGYNSYVAADTDTEETEIVLEHFGVYLGATSVPADNTVFAKISDVKRYEYPSTTTVSDVHNELASGSKVVTMPVSVSVRSSGIAAGADTDDGYRITVNNTIGTANATSQLSSRIALGETIDFSTSTDKYVVVGSKVTLNSHKSSNFMHIAAEGTGSRTNSSSFVTYEGDTYVAKAIIDVQNKKVYFYRDNVLISEVTTSLSKLSNLVYFFTEYEEEYDGFAAGEEIFTIDDATSVYYNSAYEGTLADVVAAEIGTDVEKCYLSSAWYTPWKETDSHYGTETHRVYTYIAGFDATKHRCYIVGYGADENGNEEMTFAQQVTSNGTSMAMPYGSFEKIKVFIWTTNGTPLYRSYELDYCRR